VSRGVVPNSNTLSFPAAGTFYWQAVYSGDAHNPPAVSTCTDEKLTVAKTSPTARLVPSDTSIKHGEHKPRQGTLLRETSNAGGAVTYRVYTNSSCTTLAGPQPSPATVTVTNGNVPNSGEATFPTAGTFYWKASYSGDANNNAAASSCLSLRVK